MTKEMKISLKIMNDLYAMIEKKIVENVASDCSGESREEFVKLTNQSNAIFAACMILDDASSPEIALRFSSQILDL